MKETTIFNMCWRKAKTGQFTNKEWGLF